MSQTEMGHPSDGQLLARIHGESIDGAAVVDAHLVECRACETRLRELAADDALTGSLLRELDEAPRTADQPRFLLVTRRRWMTRALRIAGAAATLAVAAAALVVPASPVHRALFTGTAPPAPVLRAAAPSAATATAAASGIAVPASPELTVVLRREQVRGVIELRWTVTGDVTFGSRGGATAYHVASGRVSIDNQEPADEYRIGIPHTVQRLRILVGSRALFRWPEDSAQYASGADPAAVRISLEHQAPSGH